MFMRRVMASKGWFSVGMLLLSIFFCLGSGHRLLIASTIDPPVSRVDNIAENSFEPLLRLATAPSPAPFASNPIRGHSSTSSAPSLSPAISPGKHIHEDSLAPSPALSPSMHVHESSSTPSQTDAPLPRKSIQAVHFEWTDWLAEGAKGLKREYQKKPKRKPKHKVRSGHHPSTQPWFFDAWEKKPINKHTLPRNKPTADQQHEHSISGGMSSTAPFDKVAF